MDIKRKILSLISDKKDNGLSSMDFEINEQWEEQNFMPKEVCTQYIREPSKDSEAIQAIDKNLFFDDSFDITKDIFEKLDGLPTLNDIDMKLAKLKKQLQAVSRKIYNLVLENRPAYEKGHLDIVELQNSLSLAVDLCVESRGMLYNSKSNFTETSLLLLANFKKRKELHNLLSSLRTIKTLQQTDHLIKELLKDQDYYGAIQLFQEYKTSAISYDQFICIKELSNKMEDKLNMIEEALDVALSKTCHNFDHNIYTRIQKALALHGKTQGAMDQLLMHFSTCIFNISFAKVFGYVQLGSQQNESEFQKKDFSKLCTFVKADFLVACLVDLCKALWHVLLNYRHVLQWHLHCKSDKEDELLWGHDQQSFDNLTKLKNGRVRIWNEVQQKIKTFLISIDLSSFKFELFLQILDVVSVLTNVGKHFCESKCEILSSCVYDISVAYFLGYHHARLDELRMFMENEAWFVCPVNNDFNVKIMPEFKFLTTKQSDVNEDIVSDETDLFLKYGQSGTPFNSLISSLNEPSGNGNNMQNGYDHYKDANDDNEDDDDDVCDELKMDYVDEKAGDLPPTRTIPKKAASNLSNQLIVTNTTLYVCRLFGKYMQMMKSIGSISYEVINAMTQLLDYYLYTVYSFFTTEVNHYPGDLLMPKLRIALKRICENLIMLENSEENSSKYALVGHPKLSPLVALDNRKDMFGLSSRIVATESLIFLADQLKILLPYLDDLIPENKKAFLQQYTSQTLNIISEVRRPVYFSIVYNFLKFNRYLANMSETNWDLEDIQSQHSSYIDQMINDITMFSDLLSTSSLKQLDVKAVKDVIWEHVAVIACEFFVEGFASAKKCTNEGRAFMLLDFNHFVLKLEKISNLRPLPRKEHVEVYIRAFYYTETELEKFISEQKYAASHLSSLINCMPQINKKTKSRLISLLDDSPDKIRVIR